MPKKRPEPPNLTTKILEQIRDELRATREDLSAAIERTNVRVERVEARQTEGEMRLASEIVAVAKIMHEIRDILREQHAKQLADLTGRVALLEQWRKASGE